MQPHLHSGERVAIVNAPIFSFSAYVVYESNLIPDLRDLPRATLQEFADAREEVQTDMIEKRTDQVVFDDEPEEEQAS